MKKNENGILYANILKKIGDTLTKVIFLGNDLEITSVLTKQSIFLISLDSQKFLVTCLRQVSYEYDFIYSIIQYNWTEQSITCICINKIANLDGVIKYYNYYYLKDEDGSIIYMINNEIRYQIRNAPRCIEYVVPSIFTNQKGTLDFSDNMLEEQMIKDRKSVV